MVVLIHFLPWELGDALGIQGLGDVQDAVAVQYHLEDAAGHGVMGRVQFSLGRFLAPSWTWTLR